MRMMMISMSSVTLVVLDAVQERWFSYCDHQNPLSCSTACPGLPVHAVRPLSSFSSEFLTLKVLLLDTVQKAWAMVPNVPAGVCGQLGQTCYSTQKRGCLSCLEPRGSNQCWFPSTNVTPLSSQPEKVKTLPKYPQGGETEARSLGHLVSISPKAGKRQACGGEATEQSRSCARPRETQACAL